MDRLVYLNMLYDCYKDLFTEKQQLYFEAYYWENLSLSEIATNYQVSRNAVHNQLKIMEEKLEDLETKLRYNEKRKTIIKLLENKVDKELFEKIKGIL